MTDRPQPRAVVPDGRRPRHGRRRLRHAVRSRRRRPGQRRRRARLGRAASTRTPCSTGRCPPTRRPRRPLGPDWALQVPADYVEVLRDRRPRGPAPTPGVDPAAGDRHRHRLHRLHDAADDRRRHPAVRAARATPTGRTPTSSCGSTTPPSRRPTGSTSSPRKRGESWLPRYGGLISSEWEFAKGLQLLEEDPEIYAAMEHWVEAADWIVWQLSRRVRPQRLHRRLQGHLPGRHLPDAGLPRRAQPRLRRLRRRQARRTRSASSARPPAG